MRKKNYLTITEVAKLTGLTTVTITTYCKTGKIKAVQLGGIGCKWLIEAEALERFLNPEKEKNDF